MIDYDSLWDAARSAAVAGPPVDDALLARCQRKYGVTFPPSFVEAYRRQNGGVLRDCECPECLFPVADDDTARFGQCVRPLSTYAERGEVLQEDDLEWVQEQYGNPRLIFPLWTDGHVVYALNFNKRGPAAEPGVVYFDFECAGDEELAESFDQWLASLLAADEQPSVDWGEIGRRAEIARETVEVEYPGGDERETVEQVLCREGKSLLLFTRTVSTIRGTELAKVTLPDGIDPGEAMIRDFRPPPCRTFTLHLQPKNLNDIGWVTSQRTTGGQWKNGRSQGVPIYCTFESKDRAVLERLRNTLLAGKVPKRVAAQEEMNEHLRSMSLPEMQPLHFQQMLAGLVAMDEADDVENLGPVPPELAEAMSNLERLKKQMMADPGELIDAPLPGRTRRTSEPPGLPRDLGPPQAALSAADEAAAARYEALCDEIVETLKTVADEASARTALERIEPKLDELGVMGRRLGVRMESPDRDMAAVMALHQRFVEPMMRLQEQVYRIQHGVAGAGQHLLRFVQRLHGQV